MTASTTKKKSTFHWRLWAIGGAHGWRVDTRRRLLAHLKSQGWQPKTLTVREEAGATAFNTKLALTALGGPEPTGMRLQGPAFDLWLDLSRRAAVEVYSNSSSLAAMAHWADQLFADLLPDFAWLVPWVQPVPPDLTALLGDLQGATGPGGDFQAHGPIAPGLVSWLGPGAPQALHEALSGLTSLRVERSPKGLMRLNLPCGAAAPIVEQLRWWPAARDACRHTGWFAERRTAGEPWRTPWQAGRQWPSGAAPSQPRLVAEAQPSAAPIISSGPASELVAAARAGSLVTNRALIGLNTSGVSWCKLRGENLNFEKAVLKDVNLSDTRLVDCNFDMAQLERCRFDSAQLDQVQLRYTQGTSLTLMASTLIHCFLQHASLIEANFSGALLRGCYAVRLDATRANFEGALLEDVDLTGAMLRGARFSRTVLRGCRLDGADLRDVDWKGATLDHCSRDKKTFHVSID